MQRHILLVSNSQQHGLRYMEHAQKTIKAFLETRVKEVLFIPYASIVIPYDQYANKVREVFKDIGIKLKSLHESANPISEVSKAQALVVAGGNTFRLLKILYALKLIVAIRNSVFSGVPYIGFSAGANIACPTIKTTNDMPAEWPPSLESLGLVPFQINPHYTDVHPANFEGETRDARIAEFTALNKDVHVIGLREGAMLRIEGDSISLIGKPIKVFLGNNLPRDYGSGPASLNFLLKG